MNKQKLRFAIIRLLVSFVTFCLAGAAFAIEPFVVKDIRLKGIQRIEAGTVFNYLPVKVGDTVGDAQASQAIKALYATGFFEDVAIASDADTLVISVLERPAIASVDFVGLKEFDKPQMLKALKDTGIAEARIFDRVLLGQAEQELKRQYLARGKYATTIATTVTPLERNRVAIQLSINEGQHAQIKQVNIVGAKAYDVDTLLDLFDLGTTGVWSWYSKNDRYSKQRLSANLEKLRSFYLDRGHLGYKLNSTQVSISPDRNGVYITINIFEGMTYKVASISLAGNLGVPHEELEKLIKVKTGDVFSREKMNKSTRAISARLGKEGYAFANVSATPEIHEDTHTADFTILVDLGRRVYVRRINISGNAKTADKVIRREMRQMESGLYDSSLISLSKRRIDKLRLFQDVSIEPQPVSGTVDQVDINVSVTEKPTGNVEFGAGYSNSENLVLTTSIKQDNIFGSGKNVVLAVNTSKANRRLSFSFTDPYFTVDGISFGFDAYTRRYNPTSYSTISRYKTDSFGGGFRWGIPISEQEYIGIGIAADRTKITTYDDSPYRYLDFVNRHGDTNDTYPVTLSWSKNTKDSFIYPTSGAKHIARAEVATPLGSLRYYRLRYDYSRYLPISKSFTFSFNTGVSYADGYQDRELPFYKNYFAGGIGSVRGYSYGGIGPREEVCEDHVARTACALSSAHIGGNYRVVGRGELLYGVPGYEKVVRLGLFYDVGQVFAKEDSFEWNKLRYSSGVSLSWVSPVGPMAFSYGIPLNETVHDSVERLQFSLGVSF